MSNQTFPLFPTPPGPSVGVPAVLTLSDQKNTPEATEQAGKCNGNRRRDPLFDALAIAGGSDPLQLTRSAARTIAVALAEIKQATPSVTPEEIARRASIYPAVMPRGTILTAHALVKHWARCDTDPRKKRDEPRKGYAL